MTQKHTKRPFLMAIVHMPLALAVRRPIREPYPLIPCMNYTIPNNMRVYSARDIILENVGGRQNSSSSEFLSRSNSSTSSTLDGTSSTASQKFVSLNLSDSDDDEADVAGILEIKASSPVKSSASPRQNPASLSITVPDDPDSTALREVVMGKDKSSNDGVSIDMGEQELKSRVKKKIIPNEIFSKKQEGSASDDECDSPEVNDVMSQRCTEPSPSTVVDMDHSQVGETIVDISKLQGDVIIEVPGDNSNVSKLSNTQTPGGKKKILPPSELLSQTAQRLSDESASIREEESTESSCVYDDIASGRGNERQKIPPAGNPHKTTEEDANLGKLGTGDLHTRSLVPTVTVDNSLLVEDTSKLPGMSLAPRTRSGSEVSSEVGSTATSRPETPVWDFYDFTDEVPEEGDQVGEGSKETGNKDGGDDASKALGTLQESILRLSRSTRLGAAAGNSNVLETERVDGPVLPTVMIEDFEEMEEATEEEDEGQYEEKENANIKDEKLKEPGES